MDNAPTTRMVLNAFLKRHTPQNTTTAKVMVGACLWMLVIAGVIYWASRESPESTALERAWTIIAVVSIGFTAWIVDDNVRNYAAVRKAVLQGRATLWGPRGWVAFASLVSSITMFVVWLGFAAIGIMAMTVDPLTTPLERRVWIGEISGWVLLSMTLLLSGIQIWQVFARTKIRPLVAPSDDERTARLIAAETAGVAEAAAHVEVATIAAANSAAEAADEAHVVATAASDAVEAILRSEQAKEKKRNDERSG